jgi:hypothetical protein
MGVIPALLGTRVQTWEEGLPLVCAVIILSFFFIQTVPKTQEGFHKFAWAPKSPKVVLTSHLREIWSVLLQVMLIYTGAGLSLVCIILPSYLPLIYFLLI